MWNIHVKLYEIWWFREEMSFKKVYRRMADGRTHDGQRPITIAHLAPSAQVS